MNIYLYLTQLQQSDLKPSSHLLSHKFILKLHLICNFDKRFGDNDWIYFIFFPFLSYYTDGDVFLADSHVLCHIWARKSQDLVISLTLKVISFFFFGRFQPQKQFLRKKKGYHKKKKDITPYILRFFGSKHPYNISQKTSANGEKRCSKKNFISVFKFFEIGGLFSRVFWKKNV